MDQSYGSLQSAIRTNLQLIINEHILAEKTRTLLSWMVGLVVFDGEDPETVLIVGLAFWHMFFHEQNIRMWEKLERLSHSARYACRVKRSVV